MLRHDGRTGGRVGATSVEEEEEASAFSAACPNVDAYTPIDADCAKKHLYYIGSLPSLKPCTYARASDEVDDSESGYESMAEQLRQAGLLEKYLDKLKEKLEEYADKLVDDAKGTWLPDPSPLAGNLWVEGMGGCTYAGSCESKDECWYLGETADVTVLEEALEGLSECSSTDAHGCFAVDAGAKTLTVKDAIGGTTVYGNQLVTDCATTAANDAELKDKSDHFTWILYWLGTAVNLFSFVMSTVGNLASIFDWTGISDGVIETIVDTVDFVASQVEVSSRHANA